MNIRSLYLILYPFVFVMRLLKTGPIIFSTLYIGDETMSFGFLQGFS